MEEGGRSGGRKRQEGVKEGGKVETAEKRSKTKRKRLDGKGMRQE